jgi:cytochrome c oxidase assembly factor CtaG
MAAVGRRIATVTAVCLGLALVLGAAPVVLAHDAGVLPEPTIGTFLFGWGFDPTLWLPAIATLALWQACVRRVDRAHPDHRVAPARTAAFVAGVAVVLVALDSGIGRYDDTLLSDHMVQHLLLTLIAPPLLLLAGPVTLALQAAPTHVRRRWLLPMLHSRILRVLGRPAVAWMVFTAVLWGTHFSPVYELSLENDWVHDGEHLLYLASALLFWLPVVGRNPAPWRLSPAASVLYVGLQMPQMTFLALAIFMAPEPLYPYYADAARTWGPTALADQQLAGAIMWVFGDLVFIIIEMLLVIAWMRDEERRAVQTDRRLDAARAGLLAGQPPGGTDAPRYSR